MPYQTFPGQRGDSNSFAKLQRLQLPNLEGKKFLDIGCNEGFFCSYAKETGASQVIGIDSDEKVIALAKKRFPDITFIHQSWNSLPEYNFDIIVMSSAIHYEKRQDRLIKTIYNSLADDGTFVLECGFIGGGLDGPKRWTEVQRGKSGTVRFPTYAYLVHELLKDFAVRFIGPSVEQAGDPIPRGVLHCNKLKNTAILIPGQGKTGKSSLASEFARSGIPVFQLDGILHEAARNAYNSTKPIFTFISSNFHRDKIPQLVDLIIAEGLADDLARLIVDSAPIESRLFVLEGYVLTPESIHSSVVNQLRSKNLRVWITTPA